jgi:hypothetical protein
LNELLTLAALRAFDREVNALGLHGRLRPLDRFSERINVGILSDRRSLTADFAWNMRRRCHVTVPEEKTPETS